MNNNNDNDIYLMIIIKIKNIILIYMIHMIENI